MTPRNEGVIKNKVAVIRIINIGDSITQGGLAGRSEFSYRLPLYRMLQHHHINADFIGAHKNGVSDSFKWPANFDQDNEGFYGATTAEVRDALKIDLVKVAAPDIAIIDLGSNDIGKNVETAVVQPMREIVYLLRHKNPNIKIILVQIPGVWQNLRMHYYIWRLSVSESKANSPVETVSLYWVWDTSNDTFDGSHPNLVGQEKMAEMLFEKIKNFTGQ